MIANNLPELFIKQVKNNNKRAVFEYRLRRNKPSEIISWEELAVLVKAVSYGLVELGLKKGDKVAILSNTRYEWAVFDLAILSCGAVVVPIYPTLADESVNYILNNSGCELVIVEDKGQLQKIRSQWEKVPLVRFVIVIEDLGDLPQHDGRILTFKDIKDKGELNFSKDPRLIEKHIGNISPSDIASIIYTSGTTGLPKGVVITHKNILSVLSSISKVLPVKKSDKFLSFLPLSHVFERVGGLFYALLAGSTISYCSGIDQISLLLKTSDITVMLVVPRILEKIISKINKQIELLPDKKKKLLEWAFQCGRQYLILKSKSNFFTFKFLTAWLKYVAANIFVFSKLRKNFAPKLRLFISGGAPLSKETAEFFFVIGIPVLEGYGLTETSAPVSVNPLGNYRIGTVGKPLPGVQIKILDDGEIAINGDNVFAGYYKDSSSTNKTFSDDWFLTGDLGEFDKDGFLKITGRKKDIIITSSGKNIAPQNIELAVKNSPFISNVVVIGDKRKYLSALVTLDLQTVTEYAQKNKIPVNSDINKLYSSPQINELIDKEIKLVNASFADYEQIRRFTILPDDFSIENGEITPTMKVKRNFVEKKYKHIIDAMYTVDS